VTPIWSVALQRRGVPLWLDCAVAFALFASLGIWGTGYWQRTAGRGQPYYYQIYFEPAVMVACGKGYVVARPQVPEMVAFLQQRTDRFSCDAIGPDARLGTDELFQVGSWRYLMLTVGYAWRLLGVSWSGLGPLFGTLFGVTIAAAYALFRLGMSPLLAVVASMALRFATLHLKYLGALRDYAKAPFTLMLFFLLGLLVAGRTTWKRVLTIAVAYGVVLGIGYGFRTDFESDIPPFLVTLVCFLEGGVSRNLRLKAAAAALFAATFLVTAWPVISTLEKARSGCGWHVVLLGFADNFYAPLGVVPAPYEMSRKYLDEWGHTNVTSYMARVHPGTGHIGMCDSSHSVASREYLMEGLRRFPADAIVRLSASVRRIVELPFSPVPGIDDEGDRPVDWGAGHGIGLSLVLVTIALTMAVEMRVGLFLLFFLLYFGALPAIQFDHRHFFHLIFITWWAGGFLVQSAISDRDAWRNAVSGLRQATIVLAGCMAAFLVVLWTARAYQQPAVRAMLSRYLEAPRDQIPLAQVLSSEPRIRVSAHTDPETADLIAVDVNASRCGERTTVAFRYGDPARKGYERSFVVGHRGAGSGLTHIFMPIYDGFQRLELSDAPSGCVDGVYRVRKPEQFTMLLEAILPPEWKREPLYQRLD
jgi:hypothetical protein